MKIILRPGEKIEIELENTDGVFTIEYDVDKSGKLLVTSDLADDTGREGIIYEENFNTVPTDIGEAIEESVVLDSPNPYGARDWTVRDDSYERNWYR